MLRSKTSTCIASAAIALTACKQGAKPVAELASATGPVEREEGTAAWQPARLGTDYFIGDAARTRDGTATLAVGGGAARIVMTAHTTLRFGGRPGESKIAVEVGAIDLSGTGNYALDIGNLVLSNNGAVRITSKGNGQSSVELTIGQAQVATGSETFDLKIGTSVDVGTENRRPIDAGVPDAAVPVDAAPSPDAAELGANDAKLEVTGRRVELQLAGQTAWKPLPAGTAVLPRGSALRLGPGTTAVLVAGDTTLTLGSGGMARLGDDGFALESGTAQIVATAPASVALPGGAIALGSSSGGPGATASETRLESGPRETRVAVLRGGGKLTGGPGAELAMNRGESALLTRGGSIRVVDAIPGYFDFRIAAGESATIHDPRPPSSVQFQFDGKCPDGGIIEVDRDPRFRTAKVSSGRDFANVLIATGTWSYRLRCTSGGGEGAALASGRITAIRDDGRRPLPRSQGVNDIDADGRTYRISYQSAIPNLSVHIRNPGSSHRLHLASGGKEQIFESSTPAIPVPGAQLHEGNYSYWIDRDGAKQDKVSTLIIDFDQTAPQVYIESPNNAQPWNGDIDVRGAVLPGWSAAVDDVAIPIDRQRRFAAKVGIPGGQALAIRLSHPQRGVHYYLRRPK